MVVNLTSMAIVPILFLGLTILVILVCNVLFLRKTSKNEHQCNRTLLWLGKFISVQSFLGGIFVTGIHMSSLIAGEWLFSEDVCQVYGVITHTWLASGIWTLLIANLERVSEVTSFVDHAVTFSVNNIKLLVLGMFMINVMICCFPLFGMAEYTTYRGKVSLYVNITSTSFDNTTKEEMTSIYGKFINLKLLPSLNTFFKGYAARKTVRQQTVGQFRFSYGEEETLLHLRIKSLEKLETLNATDFSSLLYRTWEEFDAQFNTSYALWNISESMNVYLQQGELGLYRDVMIPLQEATYCNLDFTQDTGGLWIFIIIGMGTSLLLPILTIISSYILHCVCFDANDVSSWTAYSEFEKNVSLAPDPAFFLVWTSYCLFWITNLVYSFGVPFPLWVLSVILLFAFVSNGASYTISYFLLSFVNKTSWVYSRGLVYGRPSRYDPAQRRSLLKTNSDSTSEITHCGTAL